MNLILIKIHAVLQKKGLLGLLRIFQKKLLFLIGVHQTVSRYRKNGFVSYFKSDGGIVIDLLPVGYLSVFMNYFNFVKTVALDNRTNSEPLLRYLVSELYQSGFVNADLAIVNIGAWIGDNSLVWAKLLSVTGKGKVFAIDPSEENLKFIKNTANHNSITNLETVAAVCSDQEGYKMNFSGSLTHASFSNSGLGYESGLRSTTLDNILGENKVGFLHLDVEGLEYDVLRGAKSFIKRDRPIVIFEQHLNEDKPEQILDWLAEYGYSTFIINENLIENKPDCRNFISFPVGFPIEKLFAKLSQTHFCDYFALESEQPMLISNFDLNNSKFS